MPLCSSFYFLSLKHKSRALCLKSTPSHGFVNLFFQMKLTRHREINEMLQRVKVFDGMPGTGKVLSHFQMLKASFPRMQAAPELCKDNKVPSGATIHRLQWKHHHHLSPSPPHPLMQLLIWQRSKEINEVLQLEEGFTGRRIVGRGNKMRIW